MRELSKFVLGLGVFCAAIGQTVPVSAKENPATGKVAPQPLVGDWMGTLKVGAVKIRLAVTVVAKPDGSYSGTLNSLDQDATPHPLDEVSLKQNSVRFAFKRAGLVIEGTLNEAGTDIAAKLKQGGASLPMEFKKLDHPVEGRKRPQQPHPPYPYRAEEVTYENKAAHAKFTGTLTIPRGPGRYPVALLLSGSGQQDRDEQIMGHRPFLVLADYLTRHGIAVLRVDDRGVGGSTGDVMHATTEDFAKDALAAIAYLKTRPDIDVQKMGLIGHSEGGEIAPMVANQTSDIAFIVLLAGPGQPGDEIVLGQMEFLLKQSGASDALVARTRAFQQKLYAAVKEEHEAAPLAKKVKALYHDYLSGMTDAEKAQSGASEQSADASLKVLGLPWFRFFLSYDPRPALTQLKCPVLALIGEKDMQVPPKGNIPELEKALRAGGNRDVTVRELPKLNHLFQTCENGSVTEYAKIEETFSPKALEIIGKWIQDHTAGNASGVHAAERR
ncbi:MAG TPA: alpha/beta hydrolase [Planctomycetaceae bacterium]|jgi:pimeloyl-ACP methyl ester carboxylesterase|nr:alpha/beta hydrolase [Planctomycetaceae bacterium]